MKKTFLSLLILFIFIAVVYVMFFHTNDEFAEGDLYQDIIKRGYIKAGINVNSKPFGFYDEKGNVVGYDADLAHYIAQYVVKNRNGVKFVPVTPSNRLIMASTGEVDIVISTVTITPQRQEVVSFSIPYDTAGQALLVKSSGAVKGMQDLSGRTVGVIFGTTAEKNISRLVPTASVRGFRSYPDAYQALKEGQIDAITSDDTILNRFALEDKGVTLLPRRYSNEPYGIAFKKSESSVRLKEELDYAIKDMQRKNIINRLRKKWGLG